MVLEEGKSKIKVVTDFVSVKTPSWFADYHLVVCPHVAFPC